MAAQPAARSTSSSRSSSVAMSPASSATRALLASRLRVLANSSSLTNLTTTAAAASLRIPPPHPLQQSPSSLFRASRPLLSCGSRRALASTAAAAAASSSDAVSAASTTSTTTAAPAAATTSTPSTTPQPAPSKAYPFADIEAKWQRLWEKHETFRTPDLPGDLDTTRPKAYVLDMFPYPSGAGLHVGHPEGYTATDIVARHRRMRGHNVLHPIGWDAFGLPAEQYAIQTGTHPAVTTERNVNRFRQQLKALGFSYDWSREVSTTDPGYYKWTQWIFLQLFKKGLAYQATVPVNWCPALGTVLANEEVVGGVSERGGHPVVRLPMKQWMLRITAYADRLLEGLDGLEWDENIKDMQRNWIGRSEGCDIVFDLVGGPGSDFEKESSSSETSSLTVFTTRADTLFGVTYVVLAPEHPLALKLATPDNRDRVKAYVELASSRSDLERTAEKTGAASRSGVATGSFAVHPVTGKKVPVWVADYVLGSYGTGAVMAVPAHDSRDADFAKTHGLPTVEVVVPANGDGEKKNDSSPFTSDGVCVNSSSSRGDGGLSLDGLPSPEARAKVGAYLSERRRGGPRVSYKLRDWLFARQRYWGEPFPIAYAADDKEQETPIALDESELPLVLPPTDDFSPNGTPDPPLAALKEWANFTDPKTGAQLTRETSTMPQWAGSCWYYVRYLQPKNDAALVDRSAADYWLPVDLYVGGAEHAVLHLLYARFWHKVLYDLGVVPTDEPFARLVSQGMILGEVEYTARRDDATGAWCVGDADDDAEASSSSSSSSSSTISTVRVDPSEAVKDASSPTGLSLAGHPGVHVSARAHKMSKSRGNVVNPDDVVAEFGADSLRLYEMFMGPLRDTKVWSTRSVDGVHRFLARAWRLTCENPQSTSSDAVEPTREQLRLLHATIKRVSDDTEGMRFNTAISAMMEFVNGATKWETPRPRGVLRTFALLLAPYAPHLAEEAWEQLGGASFARLAPRESYEDSSNAASSSSASSSSNSDAPYTTLAYAPWPVADESLLVADTVTLAVQVNGKMRGTIELPADLEKAAGEAQADEAARALPTVSKLLGAEGAKVVKTVYVPGRIINFIVAGGGGGGGGGGKKKKGGGGGGGGGEKK